MTSHAPSAPLHARLLAALRARLSPGQRRVVKFLIVGGSGVAVNLVVVWIGTRLMMALSRETEAMTRVVFLAGILVSIFSNFLINDRWTWGDRPKHGPAHWVRRLRDFYLAASVAGAIQWLIAAGVRSVVHFEAGFLIVSPSVLANLIATLCGIVIGTPINYVVNHFWTYRER